MRVLAAAATRLGCPVLSPGFHDGITSHTFVLRKMRLVEDVNPRGPLAGKRAELVPWGKECGPF